CSAPGPICGRSRSCSGTPRSRPRRATPTSTWSTWWSSTRTIPGPRRRQNRPMSDSQAIHATTVLAVRRDAEVVLGGDGQVTMGNTVMKATARKVRRMSDGKVIAGFAGSAADGVALFERLEGKLKASNGNLPRAAVELAKDWRTDRALR